MIDQGEGATLAAIRTGLLLIFVVGVVGTLIELLLLGHWDGWTQWIPLVLLGLALPLLAWYAVERSPRSLRVFRGMMALFVMSGVAGIILHYRGNVGFELEMSPAMHGWALFKEAVTGATPSLAPGAMAQLGLLGWAYTFRHPVLKRSAVAGARSTPKE